jgi:hypothetical protein
MTQEEIVKDLDSMKSEISEIETFLAGESTDETVNAEKIARLKDLNNKYSDLAKQLDSENADLAKAINEDSETDSTTDSNTTNAEVESDTDDTISIVGASTGSNTPSTDEDLATVTTATSQAA